MDRTFLAECGAWVLSMNLVWKSGKYGIYLDNLSLLNLDKKSWYGKREAIEDEDMLVVRFGEKYYNKEFDFTHGVIQRVRGICRKLNSNERMLYLLSDTRVDEKFNWPTPDDADKEFIKVLKDNNNNNSFDILSFELCHRINGFCFGELDVLLSIILDKEEKLVKITN